MSPHQHATCRSCGAGLKHVVVDLGLSPLANSYLSNEDLHREEPRYPLRVFVCAQCFLVQLEAWETPENIFGDYAYFSSYSQSWLKHAETYVSDVIARFGAKSLNQVIEIASNDGYLLQYFRERGVSVLGIEPARNVAEAARDKGIPTRSVFFGEETARALRSEGIAADLLIGNNVLAHVPDLNDFVEGIRIALADYGVVTMEFPHLMRLMEGWQIDTIYHEHFSYFSLLAVQKVFEAHDMTIFDVEELSTHGGSLRIYAQHRKTGRQQISDRVAELKDRELRQGYGDLACYLAFGQCAQSIRTGLRKFLVEAKLEGKRVVGYGAPAKGNTLLNYCGIGTDLIEFTVDRSPHKQGKYLPGSHIPILDPDAIAASKPDYIVILPWNLKDEIVGQMSMARSWGGKFVVPIPRPTIVE
ncbi:SAM-dependent methyltransferase [Rhodopseudomonas palustris]|uniref:SAM-dependent methyltransferase n=1 Tax=Rhodopseudomonas palustris TaxID=1076 RepID=A0A0D7F513_RHOPL|nr:SAM-dependent methyltransferase [Rhodopseudomonas palustris]